MRIDYTKLEFTQQERNMMHTEATRLLSENPKHTPVLILIKSKVMSIEKNKYLIADDINCMNFLNILKTRLTGLQPDDTINMQATRFSGVEKYNKLDINSDLIKDIYSKYKDPETGLLIITLSRATSYKSVKKYVKSFF